MSAAVEVVDVRKSYGEVLALAEVNLAIEDRTFVSLLGASGCGKSTLLRIIAGFETASGGSVRIHGADVTRLAPHRRPTNMVFQRGALFPHMNVFDNVAYSLKLRKWPRERIHAKVEAMLALVRLEGYGRRAASELSGGQAQRVALARALAAEPQVLLLDEPLSALDLKLRQQMQLELRAIQRTLGATFVFVTHDQTEALVMSDRIAIMDRGRIVQVGTPREIYTRPSSLFVSDFIGQTNFLKGSVGDSGGGMATLRLADGQMLRGESATPLAPGSAATISIRPEAIRLAPAGGDGLRGTIGEVIYLGGSVRVGVSAGGGLIWVDLRDDEAEGLAPGMPVVLTWKPSAATVWAGEAAP
jgi:ABC-type Fe3+/spermidine/putrescine transport system ATPase subunit